MLPRIKINFVGGQLGTVGDSPDGLVAIACGATPVAETFKLGKSYTVRSLRDVVEMGITASNNPRLYKHLVEFYDEVEDGTKVVVFGVEKNKKLTDVCDDNTGALRELIFQQNGALRAIFVGREDNVKPAVTEGLDPDVFTALPKAQQLAEMATVNLFAPLLIVLEGRSFNGLNLKDLSKLNNDRVAVLVGDTTSDSNGACIGVMAGRLANTPVQRNIGRVKDGALSPVIMYLGAKPIEESESLIADLCEKHYIAPRRYVGRTGYFFVDDALACLPTHDYAHITHRRVIDKAYRVAYNALLDLQLDELEVNEDGTLQLAVIKSWEQTVENAINKYMTANGELSAGVDGNGCKIYINEKQNVLQSSKVEVNLAVRPFGYARYIDVSLGFLVTSN